MYKTIFSMLKYSWGFWLRRQTGERDHSQKWRLWSLSLFLLILLFWVQCDEMIQFAPVPSTIQTWLPVSLFVHKTSSRWHTVFMRFVLFARPPKFFFWAIQNFAWRKWKKIVWDSIEFFYKVWMLVRKRIVSRQSFISPAVWATMIFLGNKIIYPCTILPFASRA